MNHTAIKEDGTLMRKSIPLLCGLGVVFLLAASGETATELPSKPAWVIEEVDTGNVGWDTSLALDAAGHPHIGHFDQGHFDLKYSWFDGDQWQTVTVDSEGKVGTYASLALDSRGYPHISYHDLSNGALKYASWDGSQWILETVDQPSAGEKGYLGTDTSLALDRDDRPHISYYDYWKGALKYATWNGEGWVCTVVDGGVAGQDVGQATSLALDAQGYPHISYYDLNNIALKYAAWNGQRWVIQRVDTADTAFRTSLALDRNGRPRISYTDTSNDFGILKYAAWNGRRWVIQTVDRSGKVGSYSSLQLDRNDYPRISYNHIYTGDLKYAVWNGKRWTFMTVEQGDVDHGIYYGDYNSLALDALGRPHISYQRFTLWEAALKYAYATQP
jgi:hypothetical protein